MNTAKTQAHLDHAQRVNLGSYYTEDQFVDIVWRMATPHLKKSSVVLDSSCGTGNFLRPDADYRQIGGDIDAAAIKTAKAKPNIAFYVNNALAEVGRGRYHIAPGAHLCVIGNPPYNDRTSLNRNAVKRGNTGAAVDPDLQTRDLGLSFLLSYQKLQADLVCVLHPLSYLIKRANFNALKTFTAEYRLLDGKVISSGVFEQTSKTTHFPILIALYKKGSSMSRQEILDFTFEVVGGDPFALSQFDDITRYARKYPDKKQQPQNGDIFFWTLRDINALKRNRTFVDKPGPHTIVIEPRQLDYYVYIDVFKRFARHVPYYFGNCDVLIDNDSFQQHKQHFILDSLSRHAVLRPRFPGVDYNDADALAKARQTIHAYFKRLLGAHYVPEREVKAPLARARLSAPLREARDMNVEARLSAPADNGHMPHTGKEPMAKASRPKRQAPVTRGSFWTHRQRQAHSLNEISYRACFKPQLPQYFIDRFSRPGDIVLDPFLGRGTTAIQAALSGRVAYGSDVNPLSAMLTKPRLSIPSMQAVTERFQSIPNRREVTKKDQDLLAFYHPRTLEHLLSLRAWFIEREDAGELSAEDEWLRMVIINRLSGHSPGFLSVKTMPPNITVSIERQRQINARHGRTPRQKDILDIVLKKSKSLLRSTQPMPPLLPTPAPTRHQLHCRDARHLDYIADGEAALVVTSPPFLDVVDYRKDNWLRCWFAGIDLDAVEFDDHADAITWRGFIADTFTELARALKPGGYVAFEVGEVKNGAVKLEEHVLTAITGLPFTLEEILLNEHAFTKTANCWGVDNNKRGTNTNRVVVARRV